MLEVEGANVQAVPYLGYIELTLKFPKALIGAEVEVPTLTLVMPDLTSLSKTLVGTNYLDVLKQMQLTFSQASMVTKQYIKFWKLDGDKPVVRFWIM